MRLIITLLMLGSLLLPSSAFAQSWRSHAAGFARAANPGFYMTTVMTFRTAFPTPAFKPYRHYNLWTPQQLLDPRRNGGMDMNREFRENDKQYEARLRRIIAGNSARSSRVGMDSTALRNYPGGRTQSLWRDALKNGQTGLQ